MRVFFYSPYFDTAGGGERYLATLAEGFAKEKHEVYIAWHDETIVKLLARRFNLNLNNVKVCQPLSNFLERFISLRKYDLAIYLSDGSIPMPFAKKNILHFQIPFNTNMRNFINRVKLWRYNFIVVNSNFTKFYIDKSYGVNSIVIYPPVDINAFKDGNKKRNLILSVGRFSRLLGGKKQEFLIKAFRKFSKEFGQFKLVLAGGSQDKEFITELQRESKGLSVELFINAEIDVLKRLYSQALVYWHATGVGEDLIRFPERAEHFGISVVEAMSAGCVPIVFNGGGLKEIVDHNVNGFLWDKEDQLIEYTKLVIRDSKLRLRISSTAQKSAQLFSKDIFLNKFLNLVDKCQ